MKGRLHQAAAAQPAFAIHGKQPVAQKELEHVVDKGIAHIVVVVFHQHLAHIVRVADRVGVDPQKTHPQHIAIVAGDAAVETDPILAKFPH